MISWPNSHAATLESVAGRLYNARDLFNLWLCEQVCALLPKQAHKPGAMLAIPSQQKKPHKKPQLV